MSPDTHSPQGGQIIQTSVLAAEIAQVVEIEGLTISGGEPMEQAGALCDLLRHVLNIRPGLNVLCYSGLTIEQIRERGDDAQRELLGHLDCLIDGRFLESQQSNPPLRWRGSANQRVHLLSQRVQHWAPMFQERGVWLEMESDLQGVRWRGIPPPGFEQAFLESLRSRGVELTQIPST